MKLAEDKMKRPLLIFLFCLLCGAASAQVSQSRFEYDLLLKGGQVIDSKNNLSARRDVAIAQGKIAAIAPFIPAAKAYKVIDVTGCYVTPGLIDIHAHFFGTPATGLHPDSHTLRSGVTTAIDAGGSGWRSFPQFKETVIARATTRVLAWLNIVGGGMAGRAGEQDANDMNPTKAAETARQYRDLIVGFKTAHYDGPEWTAVERAVEAGTLAGLPVMVDFGTFRSERPFQELVLKKLRPGDIYTHLFLAPVPLLNEQNRVLPYLFEAQRRGVLFDVGHGQGSFLFRQAVPAVRQGFLPDTISTDLHLGGMNAGMKDLLNVMSKLLNIGMTLEDVIRRATWHPARAIHREELGHLSVGAPADIAVLRVEKGDFGFVDVYKARMKGTRRLVCELTLRDGLVVYELNGLSRELWEQLGKYGSQGNARWDGTHEDAKPKR